MIPSEYETWLQQTEALPWVTVVPDERWTARLEITGGALCAELRRNHQTYTGWRLEGTIRVRAWVEFAGTLRDFPQPRGGIPGMPDLAAAQREAASMLRGYLVNYWQNGVDWV